MIGNSLYCLFVVALVNTIDRKSKLFGELSVGDSIKVDVFITANNKNYKGVAPSCSYLITRVNPMQNLSKVKRLIRER